MRTNVSSNMFLFGVRIYVEALCQFVSRCRLLLEKARYLSIDSLFRHHLCGFGISGSLHGGPGVKSDLHGSKSSESTGSIFRALVAPGPATDWNDLEYAVGPTIRTCEYCFKSWPSSRPCTVACILMISHALSCILILCSKTSTVPSLRVVHQEQNDWGVLWMNVLDKYWPRVVHVGLGDVGEMLGRVFASCDLERAAEIKFYHVPCRFGGFLCSIVQRSFDWIFEMHLKYIYIRWSCGCAPGHGCNALFFSWLATAFECIWGLDALGPYAPSIGSDLWFTTSFDAVQSKIFWGVDWDTWLQVTRFLLDSFCCCWSVAEGAGVCVSSWIMDRAIFHKLLEGA